MAGMQDFKFRVVWEGHFHFQRAQEMPSPVKDAATWLPYNSNAPRYPTPRSEAVPVRDKTQGSRVPHWCGCPAQIPGREAITISQENDCIPRR